MLRLTPEDAADQLGHRDGGKLVRMLYGHLGGASARERIREAFRRIQGALLGAYTGPVNRLVAVVASAFGLVVAVASDAGSGATPAESCAVARTLPAPPADRPKYVLRVRVEDGLTRASGTLRVSFEPDVATDRLVFRLWPNLRASAAKGARLTATDVTANGQRVATARPEPTTLVVRRALAPGERVTVSMRWTLQLPRQPGSRLRGDRRSARLVSFFPLLAWDGAGWATVPLSRRDVAAGPDGFAFPMLSFVGGSELGLIAHETAHQWFYSLVGVNEARDPWLSEGLTTWAESGPEGSLPSLLAVRIPAAVRNRIGEPMSFWDRFEFQTIWRGLYVQPVQALATLGEPDAVDCALRAHVVRNAYRTVRPRNLLASLSSFFPEAEQKLRARGARF